MDFTACARPTVGCEWELQLLRADDLDLADGIFAVLGDFRDEPNVKAELVQACVELNSGPCDAVSDLSHEIEALAERVATACATHGMRLAGAGTHPFSRKHVLFTPSPRFLKMFEERGCAVPQPPTYATHVHVACPDGDTAMRVMRFLTPCLPALLALGANSPYCAGLDTRFDCYRQYVLGNNPSYGLPPRFDSWADFRRGLDAALAAGTIRHFKDLHWDIRPHPDFGTVEVRVLDAQLDVGRVAELTALVRALVVYAFDADAPALFPSLPYWFEKENYFRAIRAGMDATLVSTRDGDTTPVSSLVHRWIDRVRPVARELGDAALIDRLETSILSGNGARRQREHYRRQPSLHAVTGHLAYLLHAPAQSASRDTVLP